MKQYLKEMNREFGYRATWEPNKPLHIGDVGILERGIFTLLSSVDKEFSGDGMTAEVREDPNQGDLKYSSQGSVDISAGLSGQAAVPGAPIGDVDGGIKVKFKKEKAIVFQANGTSTQQIANFGDISREVIKKFMRNEWPKNWVIITELVSASSATILISDSKDSSIELKANGQMAGGTLNIADAGADFAIAAKKGLSTEIIAKSGLTPLYRVSGIKKGLFSSPTVGNKGEVGGYELDAVPFDEAELD